MVTFTGDKDYEDGGYPDAYSYHKGELVNKVDSYDGLAICSSLPILPGDVLKFTISRRTGGMGLWIYDEEFENGMGYWFKEG